MKSFNYLLAYVIFSAAAYFGSYALLKYDYDKIEIESFNDLIKTGGKKAILAGKILIIIQDLDDKMPLFCFYWPLAVKRAVEVRMQLLELQSQR